jgi:hypothetical protein
VSRKSGMTLFGANELRKSLTDAMKVHEEFGEQGIKQLAKAVQEGARERAPEKTGDLVDAIKVTTERNGRRFRATVYVDETMVPYAIYMHEGINGEQYELGEYSDLKNIGVPHVGTGVGWKFLERAFRAVTRNARKILEFKFSQAAAKVRARSKRR